MTSPTVSIALLLRRVGRVVLILACAAIVASYLVCALLRATHPWEIERMAGGIAALAPLQRTNVSRPIRGELARASPWINVSTGRGSLSCTCAADSCEAEARSSNSLRCTASFPSA